MSPVRSGTAIAEVRRRDDTDRLKHFRPEGLGLLMAWNDHSEIDQSMRASETSGGKRTPLTVAISRDDGKTWIRAHNLLDDPEGWYCYTAIDFAGGIPDCGCHLREPFHHPGPALHDEHAVRHVAHVILECPECFVQFRGRVVR